MNDIDTQTAQSRIEDLTDGLSNPALQAVASNPMLLTVMAIVHNHTGALPRESARLYHECVTLLMERWKPRDFVTLRDKLGFNNDGVLYEMVWQIAYTAHEGQADREGAADIPQLEIIGIVSDYVKGNLNLAKDFCDYVESRAGLLLGRGSEKGMKRIFTFPHRTFQEFLAGCHLAVNLDFQELAPELARRGAGWREVLLLAIGYLVFVQNRTNDALRPINEILDTTPETDADWRAIWLAGEMLEKVGVDNALRYKSGEKALKRAREHLVQLIEGGHLPPVERAGAGRILSQLGDPRPGVGTITVNGITLPDVVWCHVPAGEFIIGSDVHYDNEKPAHTLHLDGFYMSRYLVTYAQYRAFETAPDFDDDQWWEGFPEYEKRVRYDQHFQYANHPREMVTWYGAMAFCRWLTHHINNKGAPMWVWDVKTIKYIKIPYPKMTITLPSEAEYEKMARGTEGLIYPYGNDYDHNKGNTDDTGIGMTSAVGLFPNGKSNYGVLDASGNVFKWTCSLNKKYEYNSNDGREDENSVDIRILRGGSWDYNSVVARSTFRNHIFPNNWFNNFGFFVACRPITSSGDKSPA